MHATCRLISMLQPQKSGKFMNEKRLYYHNTLNNNKLQTLLITRVFATNFKVVRKYASYKRHFVKIIQH